MFTFQEYLETKIVQLESELAAERRNSLRERTMNSKLQKQLARVSKIYYRSIYRMLHSWFSILQDVYFFTEGHVGGQLGKLGLPPPSLS